MVHYCIQKIFALGHLLSQINPSTTVTSYSFFKTHFNIILPSTPVSSKQSPLFNKNIKIGTYVKAHLVGAGGIVVICIISRIFMTLELFDHKR
jgi:hypothetical protein